MNKIYKVVSTAALAAVLAGVGAVGAVQAGKGGKVEQAGNAVSSNKVNQLTSDQKLVDAAQAKLKEFIMTPVSFSKAETVDYGGEVISFSWEKKSTLAGEVLVKPDGKVVKLYVNPKLVELNDSTKSKLNAAWKQIFNKSADGYTRLNVHYLEEGGSTDIIAYSNNDFVNLVDGKAARGGGALKEVPAPIQKAAAQALSRVGAKQGKDNPRASFVIELNKKKVYALEYKTNKGNIELEIEESTNRLLGIKLQALSLVKELSEVSVENPEKETQAIREKVNSFSLGKLKIAAVKQAKEIMNLDLSGYQAAREENSGAPSAFHDAVIFTKKGSPTVTGYFNSKGVFSGFRIEQ
ncbi:MULTISPECIES: hypothetical protein [Paenibacillus]|uniref:hypothetical protein n=1 Tax=Paenibacillus TaxID=44249 RepID=UPI00119DDD4E|nr:hypothetical protein [Paenibacillus sp. IHBB 10380]